MCKFLVVLLMPRLSHLGINQQRLAVGYSCGAGKIEDNLRCIRVGKCISMHVIIVC